MSSSQVDVQLINRLKDSIGHSFDFGIPQHEVNLFVQYDGAIEKNELIFKLSLFDVQGNQIDPDDVTWSYSASAKSMYVYSPAGHTGNRVRLRQIRSRIPFKNMIVKPVRWSSDGSSPEVTIRDMWAVHANHAQSANPDLTLADAIVVSTKVRFEA